MDLLVAAQWPARPEAGALRSVRRAPSAFRPRALFSSLQRPESAGVGCRADARRSGGHCGEDSTLSEVQHPRRLPRRPARQRHVHDRAGWKPHLRSGPDRNRSRADTARSGRSGGPGQPGDGKCQGAARGGGIEPRACHHGHHVPHRSRLAGAGLSDGGRTPARQPHGRHRAHRQGSGAAGDEGGARSGGGGPRDRPAPEVPADELPGLVRRDRAQSR